MVCTSCQMQFAQWLDADLPKNEGQALNDHLAACSDCARAWSVYQQYHKLMSRPMSFEPPGDLMSKISHRIASAPPVRALSCRDARSLLLDFVEGDLRPAEHDRVLNHTLICLSCSKEIELLETQIRLFESMPPVATPADLKERILERVTSRSGALPIVPFFRRRWIWGAAGAATFGLILGTLNLFGPSQPGNMLGKVPIVVNVSPFLAAPTDSEAVKPSPRNPLVPDAGGGLRVFASSELGRIGNSGAATTGGAMALVSAGKTTPARVKGPATVKRTESGGGNLGSAIIPGGVSGAELPGYVDDDTDLRDSWFVPEDAPQHAAIPQTPLDRPKPTITVQKDTSPEPSPVFQDETPK
ncbi:MAG: hypothetical protein HY318_18755, partial [Armatimonadetes bacterium]|nr:hypothetical protein [Armatimonadota bacterium]